MKKIAIITGASSGMGRRFVETMEASWGNVDEIWAVARRKERLELLGETLKLPLRPLALDLTVPDELNEVRRLLEEEKPEVSLLINASGYGKFQAVMDTPPEDNLNMVDLNCKALMALCQCRMQIALRQLSVQELHRHSVARALIGEMLLDGDGHGIIDRHGLFCNLLY